MPRFSVLIPAYNVEPYIDVCLESVCSQSFADFEVIVVDDASTDGTPERLMDWVQRDRRIRVITHDENQGRHSARKTAVEASSGQYCFFLDSDDEIAPRLYELMNDYLGEHSVDMVRYGIEIVPESQEDRLLAFDYGRLFNYAYGDMKDEGILLASYSAHPQGFITWSMVTTLWQGDLLRNAFAFMPRQRLSRSEDAYEYFVVASRAHTWSDFTALCGYRYHIGRGISSRATMTLPRFVQEQEDIWHVLQALSDYAREHPEKPIPDCAGYFHTRCLAMIEEDLRYRVHGNELTSALEAVRTTWGDEEALTIAFALTLGRGNWLKTHNMIPDEGDHFNILQRFIHRMHVENNDPRIRELEELNSYFDQQVVEAEQRKQEEAQREREEATRAEQEARDRNIALHPRFYRSLQSLFPFGTRRNARLIRLASVLLTYSSAKKPEE